MADIIKTETRCAVQGDGPLPWQMEGIDVSTGLEYAGQDVELYREILSDYVDCIEEQAGAIERAVAERNIETFTIGVHSLKSTSRTIGALELSNMAKVLEDNGKNHEWEPILEKTPELLSVYRGLYPIIKPYHIENEPEKEKKPADDNAVRRMLSDLSDSLEEYDSVRAEEILSGLSEYDFTDAQAVYMEKLGSALGRFDYETCRKTVSRWRGELCGML